MYLFIDTTKDITVGLLDKNLSWLSYQHYEGAKGSAQIHHYIFETCSEFKIQIKNLEALFQIAGPGSYTGMRISDGISQIFNWQNFKTYSFYHFDVPRLLNYDEGVWVGNAFKGEIFLHEWNKDQVSQNLITIDEYINAKFNKNLYTSYLTDKLDGKFILTSELIKNESQKLFSKVLEENLKKELFYYRTIEQEYKRKEL